MPSQCEQVSAPAAETTAGEAVAHTPPRQGRLAAEVEAGRANAMLKAIFLRFFHVPGAAPIFAHEVFSTHAWSKSAAADHRQVNIIVFMVKCCPVIQNHLFVY
jgi:hypothetical protein